MHTQSTRSTMWDSYVLYSIFSGDFLTMCVCVCVCVCLWEEEKKEKVLGIEMAFVRGHMHRCLNTCACLA